jgi:hypothetical protein
MTQLSTEKELVNALASLLEPAQVMTDIAAPTIAGTIKAVRVAANGARGPLAHPPIEPAALVAYDLLETLADSMDVAASAFAHYGGAPLDDAQEHARAALQAALHAGQLHVRAKRHLVTK